MIEYLDKVLILAIFQWYTSFESKLLWAVGNVLSSVKTYYHNDLLKSVCFTRDKIQPPL